MRRSFAGACLSYGDGITYWPVVDVIRQLATPRPRSSSRRARQPVAPTSRLQRQRNRSRGRSGSCSKTGRDTAARRRLRRPAVGRANVPRSDRARRRLVARRAHPAAVHGPPGPARPPPGLAGGASPGAARSGCSRPSRPGDAARRPPRPNHPRGRRATPSSSRRWWRWPATVGRHHRSADHPGAPRRPARPARPARAARAGAGLGGRRDLPPGRRRGAHPRRERRSRRGLRARAQGPGPARQGPDPGRGRVPLPPPADPRRGL